MGLNKTIDRIRPETNRWDNPEWNSEFATGNPPASVQLENRTIDTSGNQPGTPQELRGGLIYVVDDDKVISRLLAAVLSATGYRVKQFTNGPATLEALREDRPVLVVLDVIMPGPNGLEVARRIRQFTQVPILMLSVRNEILVKQAALDIGADDYLVKPLRIEELLARIRAILRRTETAEVAPSQSSTFYNSGGLTVDLATTTVTSGGVTVHLTPREWALLRVLVAHAGSVVSPRQLLQEAWGPEYGDEGIYVRAYITRLRQKIEPDPKNPRYVLLHRGLGYQLARSGSS